MPWSRCIRPVMVGVPLRRRQGGDVRVAFQTLPRWLAMTAGLFWVIRLFHLASVERSVSYFFPENRQQRRCAKEGSSIFGKARSLEKPRSFYSPRSPSTGESTSTSTSTGSRPAKCRRRHNSAISVGFPPIAPTITSSTWRRIRMATARIARAEFPISPRCSIRVRRCSSWWSLGSSGRPRSYQRQVRLSAGNRAMFSALRSTGSLPVVRR
jgi:hypothetical protein